LRLRCSITLGVVGLVLVGCRPSRPLPQPPPTAPPTALAIRLKGRTFAPPAGIEPVLLENIRQGGRADRVHVIVQFQTIPSLEERARLVRTHGIRLLDPLPGRAYFASMPSDVERVSALTREARWIGIVRSDDKIAPRFARGGAAARPRDSSAYPIVVQFFLDVPLDTQQTILRNHGVVHTRRIVFLNGWTGVAPLKEIAALAAEDAVQWIDNVPEGPEDDNEGVRSAKGVNADAIHAAPYSLSGSGVTVAMWEYSPPSLTHDDFAGRITLADPPLPPWSRTQAHDEKIAANARFDHGESVYRDVDDTRTVTAKDIRVTSGGGFAAGSEVGAGDPDVGVALVVFSTGSTGASPERFRDLNLDAVYTPDEPIYRDVDDNRLVSAGDVRLSTTSAAAGSFLSSFPTNPHSHGTQVAGTLMGSGTRSLAEGWSANQWKGVAPGANLRAYAVCAGVACASQEWVPPHEVSWIASVNEDYVDAAANGAAIAANAWGPFNSHCHQVWPEETCYDGLSQLYDVVGSGRLTDGTSTGTAPILIIGSAGNAGRPERHSEKSPANGQFDDGESLYFDTDGDGKVSPDDTLRLGPGEAVDTKLVDFALEERHTETVAATGKFEATEGIYRDVDRSGHVNAGDVRLSVAGFASGSAVATGETDAVKADSLRQFVLWGNLRIGNGAKTTLQVGDVAHDAMVVAPWSSRGPTDDGRMKPDLVAAGSRVADDGLVMSTYPVNRYRGNQGTSMATGAAAGSAALLTQWYKEACSTAGPAPDVLKALLIHAAEDVTATPAGAFLGPDFATGFGRLRVREAADLVSHHVRRTVSVAGDTDIPVTIGAVQSLKVTLAWSDPPRSPNAIVSEEEVLHNDLDLTVIGPDGMQYTSWRLDPSNPLLPATRSAVAVASPIPETARDRRNPVEQVVVDAAKPGTWIIRVSVVADRLKLPPQDFILVSEVIAPSLSPCATGPAADVWIRDNRNDNGTEPSTGRLWLGPDLWNRLAADGLTVHQNPEHGQPNYLYATVRNRSAVAVKATTMEMWIASASTGLVWPKSFSFVGRIFVPNLAAGEVRRIGPLEWHPPAPVLSGHFCMYMRVLSPQDDLSFAEVAKIGINARRNNNIAYRNLNVVDLSSGRQVGFLVRNTEPAPASVDLLFSVPDAFLRSGTVIVSLPPALERRWSRNAREAVRGISPLREDDITRIPPNLAHPGPLSFANYRIIASEAVLPGLALEEDYAERVILTFFSADARPMSHDVDVMQRVGAEIVGGIRYEVRTRSRP
jgi:hypothetical protein